MPIENNTLQQWIQDNTGNEYENIIAKLIQRGYSETDLSITLKEHLTLSPFLLLNSLYETMIGLGIKDTKEKLTPLESLSIEYESKNPNAVAHFIWVGEPRNDYKDTLGVRTLLQRKPNQEIRLWVLAEFADQYKKTFEENPTIKIISIEDYAKKINITFDMDGKISLYSQIDLYVKRAKTMLTSNRTAIEKKLGIRDRVTVVDYIKTTIPLYEGGWVFDADMIFLAGSGDSLSKNKKWLFPTEKNMAGGSDVWFYYCNREMSWEIDKNNGKAFWLTPTSLQPKWQTHLLCYHEIVSLVEQSYREKLEIIAKKEASPTSEDMGYIMRTMNLYGTAILLLCDTVTVNNALFSIKFMEKMTSNCRTALTWYSTYYENFQNNRELINATQITKAQGSRILECDAYYIIIGNVQFIKRLNRSHDLKTVNAAIALCHASISDFGIQKEMLEALAPFVGNELLQTTNVVKYSADGTTGQGVCVQNVTPLHMAVLFNPENLSNLLTLITPDQLYNLCTQKINIQGPLVKDFFHEQFPPATLTELIAHRYIIIPSSQETQKENMRNCFNTLIAMLKSTSTQFSKLSFRFSQLSKLDFSGCSFEEADLGCANLNSTLLNKAKFNKMTINKLTTFNRASYSQIECDSFDFVLEGPITVQIDTKDFLTYFDEKKRTSNTSSSFFQSSQSERNQVFTLANFTSNEVLMLQQLVYRAQTNIPEGIPEGLPTLFYKVQSISERNDNYKRTAFTSDEIRLLKKILDDVDCNLGAKLLEKTKGEQLFEILSSTSNKTLITEVVRKIHDEKQSSQPTL